MINEKNNAMKEGLSQDKCNIDGDRMINSDEKGSSEMDGTNCGNLTVESDNMQEHKTTHEEQSTVRRMVVKLGYFTGILAISKLCLASKAGILSKATKIQNQAVIDKVTRQKTSTFGKNFGFHVDKPEGIRRRIIECSTHPINILDCGHSLSIKNDGTIDIRCAPGNQQQSDAQEVFNKCSEGYNVYFEVDNNQIDYICGAGLGMFQQQENEDKWTYDGGRVTVDCTQPGMWGSVTGFGTTTPTDIQPLPSCSNTGCSRGDSCAEYICCHTGCFWQIEGGDCDDIAGTWVIWTYGVVEGYCNYDSTVTCQYC